MVHQGGPAQPPCWLGGRGEVRRGEAEQKEGVSGQGWPVPALHRRPGRTPPRERCPGAILAKVSPAMRAGIRLTTHFGGNTGGRGKRMTMSLSMLHAPCSMSIHVEAHGMAFGLGGDAGCLPGRSAHAHGGRGCAVGVRGRVGKWEHAHSPVS
jgi:hypothetical protein